MMHRPRTSTTSFRSNHGSSTTCTTTMTTKSSTSDDSGSDRTTRVKMGMTLLLLVAMVWMTLYFCFYIWSNNMYAASSLQELTTTTIHRNHHYIQYSDSEYRNTTVPAPTGVTATFESAEITSPSASPSSSPSDSFSFSCVWDPYDSNTQCTEQLLRHMSHELARTRHVYVSPPPPHQPSQSFIHRRWLLIGDTTMHRLYVQLRPYLMITSVTRYSADHTRIPRCVNEIDRIEMSSPLVTVGQCSRMEQFQLKRFSTSTNDDMNTGWQIPNFTKGEGPLAFGLLNPYCTDCYGCDSEIVQWTIMPQDSTDMCPVQRKYIHHDTYTGPSSGGFLSIEFARDVELQTNKYGTTQENLISHYVAQYWNHPMRLQYAFGRPICVVGTGHNDARIPNNTLPIYLHNIQWYMDLLLQQCDYIIWISNNAPATDDYEQKIDDTYKWNMGVRNLLWLQNEKNGSINVFFLDVFNASVMYAKQDNIRMALSWYEALASFVQNVMSQLTM